MDLIKKNKNILIGAAVLIAVFGGYKYFSSNSDTSDSPLTFVEPTEEAVFIGQEILTMLNELRRLQIDGSVFQNPVFRTLVDYSIATTTEPLERPDPFEPIEAEINKSDSQL